MRKHTKTQAYFNQYKKCYRTAKKTMHFLSICQYQPLYYFFIIYNNSLYAISNRSGAANSFSSSLLKLSISNRSINTSRVCFTDG